MTVSSWDDYPVHQASEWIAQARRMPLSSSWVESLVDAAHMRLAENVLHRAAVATTISGGAAEVQRRAGGIGPARRALAQVLRRADPNDPMVQEMREKARLVHGTLLWDFTSSYRARLWKARKELRELDVASTEARRRWVLVERAREDYPARTEKFAQRVEDLQPRIAGLNTRLAQAAESQNRYLADIAVRELEAQKQRLASYSLQARFALASIYDRASSGTTPPPGGAE